MRISFCLHMCLVLGLAACESSGTSNAPADTTGSTEAAAQSAADSKKVLNIATIGETDYLYPMQMTPPTYLVSRVCYDTLVTYEGGEIIPRLAESWDISEDGCTLTLHLRKGVKFHDGENFNSEAVKANIP